MNEKYKSFYRENDIFIFFFIGAMPTLGFLLSTSVGLEISLRGPMVDLLQAIPGIDQRVAFVESNFVNEVYATASIVFICLCLVTMPLVFVRMFVWSNRNGFFRTGYETGAKGWFGAMFWVIFCLLLATAALWFQPDSADQLSRKYFPPVRSFRSYFKEYAVLHAAAVTYSVLAPAVTLEVIFACINACKFLTRRK